MGKVGWGLEGARVVADKGDGRADQSEREQRVGDRLEEREVESDLMESGGTSVEGSWKARGRFEEGEVKSDLLAKVVSHEVEPPGGKVGHLRRAGGGRVRVPMSV